MARFIDEIKIFLKAGKGGDGMISFRREAHVDKGGPDGGDGGNGGNIYFVADLGKNTLLSLYGNKKIIAEDGVNGGPKNLYGANGKDTFVKVPLGTLVYKDDKLLADVVDVNEKYLIAKGGIGGRGNAKFKSPRNTAPRISENGTKGEKFEAHIILKIMSDVGLIGKPSAGKSTLLNVLSNAKAKVADYEFTTLVPQLGLVKYFDHSFTIADLPGLIKGASLGKGLGIQFLKHIERCKVIAHIIDFGSEFKNPIEDYETIKKELSAFSKKLNNKKEIIIANKKDLEKFKEHLKQFKTKYPKLKIIELSVIKKENIDELKKSLWNLINSSKNEMSETKENNQEMVEIKLQEEFEVIKIHSGLFEIRGPKVESIYERIPLNSYDNLLRFNEKLKKIGVWDSLIKAGVNPGNTVRIMNYEFEWDGEF